MQMKRHFNKNLKLRALTGALIGAGLMAAPAYSDIVVGATIGQSDIGAYEFGTDTVVRNDDTDTAFHVFAAWQPIEHLAVALGFADLGALSVAGSYDGGEGGTIGYTDEIEATAIDVSLVGFLPLGDSGFSAFAQLGVAQVDQDITYREPGVVFNGKDDSTNLVFGAGLNYNISDSFGVHVRYVDYGTIGNRNSARSGHEQDWAAWGAGFTWKIGMN